MRKATTGKPNPRRAWIWGLALAGALVLAGGLWWFSVRQSASQNAPIEGAETLTVPARGHQEGSLRYDGDPPVGGVHNPVWINCGIYDTQLPLEKAVHSLEHGAVWITYRPDLGASEVERLRRLVRGRGYVLLSPYQYVPLPAPVMAVAWGVRLGVEQADDPRLARFLSRYANGPQTPEPGAACSGGEGRPIE